MRHLALIMLAASLLTSGCASFRQCSGRVTTDNGHVVRNIEDCTWGPQYNQRVVVVQPQQQQYVVVQPPPPQYIVVPPPQVYMAPPSSFNLNINIPLRGRRR